MDIKFGDGGLAMSLKVDEIMGTSIEAGRGYNSARIYAKISDKEYFSASYEWEDGKPIPDFVVELMNVIRRNNEQSAVKGAWAGKDAGYKECVDHFKK